MTVFDNSELEKYKAEAREKWGSTKEYKEFAEKGNGGDFAAASDGLMAIFTEIGALRHLSPEDVAVQEKIGALKEFISANFYNCSKEMLCNLGQMYVADERFKTNIDKAGGDGTAEFVNRAIKIYCE